MSVLGWLQDCGALFGSRLPLPVALLAGGLGGSFTHCLGMCSIFVVGQSGVPGKSGAPNNGSLGQTGKAAASSLWTRLLLPYHAGRLTTYAVLGAVAGASFQSLVAWPPFLVIRHLLLALVAVIFLSVFAERFLARVGLRLPVSLPFKPGCAVAAMRRASSGASVKGLQRYGMGVALGFLPCPLIYAALLAVAARGGALSGAVAMAAFGLGTMPALIGLSVSGGAFLRNSPRLKDGLGIAALGVNGLILFGLAIG